MAENASASTALTVVGGDSKEEDPFKDMPTLFSTRKPRNLGAGLSSGAKSVAKGVAWGAVGLFAAPYLGAREGGVKGFCAGVGAGILGAVTLPVSGAVVGAVQLARGAINTPEAIAELAKGKIWDEDTRQWVAYNLQEEARTILSQTEEEWCAEHGIKADGGGMGDKASSSGAVKESELYDALGVPTDATAGQIRKAYFKLAKELHPDKNQSDPHAHDKFQKVGEAYQVLSNDELRAKYDAQGKSALEQTGLVDPTSFFAMLFGSEPFEHLIGELKLATLFALGGEADDSFLVYKQKRREVLCALTLSGMLSQFVHGDEAEFEADMHHEGSVLQKAPVGVALIWTCGYIYEHKGLQKLGGFDAAVSNAKQGSHWAVSNKRVAEAAIKTYLAFRKDIKKTEGGKSAKSPKPDKGGGSSGKGSSSDGKAEGGAASASAPTPVAVGMRVRVQDLVARPDLNGFVGTVTSWNMEKERFVVELDGSGDTLLLRPPNLQVIGGAPDANASGSGDGASSSGDNEAGGGGGGGGPSEDTVLLMLESMWRVSLLDIEKTLRHACNKVLSDQSCDKEQLKARARGLVLMGRIFQSYGSADALKTTDFAQHMHQVGERMAEKMAEQSEREAAGQ